MSTLALDAIGDEPDFDARFSSQRWDHAGGCVQSLMFTIKALEILKQNYRHVVEFIARGSSLLDYGCALGDGTAVLAATFQGLAVTGVDISEVAVQRAAARWPTLTFLQGDIRAPSSDAHCIWTSHTVEHQQDPAAVINRLRERCRVLVAIVPPIEAGDESEAHKGAVPMSEWTAQVEPPLVSEPFSFMRAIPGERYLMLKEESALFVWRGLCQ